VTKNVYDGPNWWGTITFTNNGPSPSSNYVVEFDVPSGVHCTADSGAVPSGATLSPLTGSGSSAHTVSNHCIFTWSNTTVLAAGVSKTFNYSTDSQSVTSAANLAVSDSICDGGGSSCNTFTITRNDYDGPNWWGTITIKNDGPFSSSAYTAAFDVPSGVHCTADSGAVPSGATLSPLTGSGSSAHTVSNHCVFTWANGPPLAVGDSKTFNYSTDSQGFCAANNAVAGDTACSPDGSGVTGGTGGSGGSGQILETRTDVGTLPGSLSVTPSGSSTYSIPLWAPAGRNGMTPSLSLSYSSARGDGVAGLGWAISGGASVISRCVADSRTDARPAPVTPASNNYCLDGQRLVLVGGVDGTPNAEYRTQPDTFTKVVLNEVDQWGPKRFTAYSQDGLIHSYASPVNGSDASLEIKAQVQHWIVKDQNSRDDATVDLDTSAVVFSRQAWLRGTVADRFGNAIWFGFVNPGGATGEQEPTLDTIEYVDVDGFKTRSIKFNYVPRSNVTKSKKTYNVAGIPFASTQLLQSIDMRVAAPGTQTLKTVRSYQLVQTNSVATLRPRLDSIQECDGKPGATGRTVWCKKATTFSYESGSDAFALPSTPLQGFGDMTQATDSAFWAVYVGDLNHDGRGDLVYRASAPGAMPGDPPHWYARLATGTESSPFLGPQELSLPPSAFPADPIIADFDNDGFADIAVPSGTNAYSFYVNSRNSDVTAMFGNALTVETPSSSAGMQLGDFSGRGVVSILRPAAGSQGQWSYSAFNVSCDPEFAICHVTQPQFSGSLPLKFETSSQAGWNTFAADVDGDHALDLLGRDTDPLNPNRLVSLTQARVPGSTVSVSDWTSASARTTLLASQQGNLVKYVFLDQNGDGLVDALRFRQNENVPALIMNSGNGYAKPVPVTSLATDAGGVGNVALGPNTDVRDLKDIGVRILDYDRDGKDDILLVDNGAIRDSTVASNPSKRGNMVVLLSRGSGFDVHPLVDPSGHGIPVGGAADGPVPPGSSQVHNYKQAQLIDANGDGMTDIFMIAADGKPQLWTRQGSKSDLLKLVVDGMGKKTSVSYLPMTDAGVYKKGDDFCKTPQKCLTSGDRLVSSVSIDDGNGSEQNTWTFTYHDRRFDQRGGGMLGFADWTVTDTLAHTATSEFFSLDRKTLMNVSAMGATACGATDVGCIYPFVGRPIKRVVAPVAGSTSTQTMTSTMVYELAATNGGASYFTRLRGPHGSDPTGTTTTTTDTTAASNPLSTVVNVPSYDSALTNFGLASGGTVTTTNDQGTYVDVWSASYDPVGTQWLVGLKNQEVVCSTTPLDTVLATVANCTRADTSGVPKRVRTFVNDQATGAVQTMDIQPDGSVDDHLHVDYTPRGPYGLLTTVTRSDSVGNLRTDSTAYDDQSVHVKATTNALGKTTTVATDPGLGVLLSSTDPNGIVTSFSYDAFGRLRRSDLPGGGGSTITYAADSDPPGANGQGPYTMKATVVADGGGEVHAWTNRLGREIRRDQKNLDGTFSFTTAAYDHLGLLASATRPAAVIGGIPGAGTTWKHDDLGRIFEIDRDEDAVDGAGHPVGSIGTTSVYAGLVDTITDEVLRQTRYTTDSFGRVVKSEVLNNLAQAPGQPPLAQWVPTSYQYGAFGVLRFVTRNSGNGVPGGGLTTEYGFDSLGRRTTLSDPASGTSGKRLLTYNAFGDVREEDDAAGVATTYVRDSLGRATQKTDSDGSTTFTWDTAVNGVGQLAESLSPFGVRRQFFYDGAGRVYREIWTVDGSSFQVDYAFDPSSGKLVHVSYPNVPGYSRLVVTNSYDSNTGRLSRVLNDKTGSPYWTLSATRVDGQIKTEVFGNGVTTNYDYSDITGRIKDITTTKAGVTAPLRSWEYAYLPDGDLQRRSNFVPAVPQHERFEYDSFNRIRRWVDAQVDPASGGAAEVSSGWSVAYTFDDFGNMSDRKFAVAGTTQQDLVFHAGSDRVGDGPWGPYGYDANGNQTLRPNGETITYTAFNLPKLMTGPVAASFEYDASGTRSKKQKDGNNPEGTFGGGVRS
jgi:YD repeat-containing protein